MKAGSPKTDVEAPKMASGNITHESPNVITITVWYKKRKKSQ